MPRVNEIVMTGQRDWVKDGDDGRDGLMGWGFSGSGIWVMRLWGRDTELPFHLRVGRRWW